MRHRRRKEPAHKAEGSPASVKRHGRSGTSPGLPVTRLKAPSRPVSLSHRLHHARNVTNSRMPDWERAYGAYTANIFSVSPHLARVVGIAIGVVAIRACKREAPAALLWRHGGHRTSPAFYTSRANAKRPFGRTVASWAPRLHMAHHAADGCFTREQTV